MPEQQLPPAEDLPIVEQPKVEVPLEDPVETDKPEPPADEIPA